MDGEEQNPFAAITGELPIEPARPWEGSDGQSPGTLSSARAPVGEERRFGRL